MPRTSLCLVGSVLCLSEAFAVSFFHHFGNYSQLFFQFSQPLGFRRHCFWAFIMIGNSKSIVATSSANNRTDNVSIRGG